MSPGHHSNKCNGIFDRQNTDDSLESRLVPDRRHDRVPRGCPCTEDNDSHGG